jgi:CheY-like chemotaxis protein
MTTPWEVVVACSDPENCQKVAGALSDLGIEATCTSTVEQCREVLSRRNIGLVLCDRELRDGTYWDILSLTEAAGSGKAAPQVVVMSAVIKSQEYARARARGLLDVIPTPCLPTDIKWIVLLAKSFAVSAGGRPDVIPPMTPAV